MADLRDYRWRQDLTVPAKIIEAHPKKLATLRKLMLELFGVAVNIHPDGPNLEAGFIDLERCGHRMDLGCDKIARWEVGKGQVFP